MNKNRTRLGVVLGAAALVFAFTSPLGAKGVAEQSNVSKAKYVFFFVGDGMAMPQVNAAEIYKSVAAKYKTLAEYAKDGGYKVGVVSSVSLDHATPAATYAKVASRGQMYDIDVQLAQSAFDYFGGGGLVQKGRKDGDPDALDLARKNGFTVVGSKKDFEALKPGVGKVLAMNSLLQDESALIYEMDRAVDDLSLADYTRKGIELLDNPKGFFMVVEGGKIDWACHANDASAAIKDTLAFDDAVVQAVKFADAHPDETLIVVTGDHETGGMTIGFSGTKYSTFFDKIGLKYQDLSDNDKEMLDRAFRRSLGNELERVAQENVYNLYDSYEPFTVALTHILNQSAGIGWTSYSHTGVPVATFARGIGQNLFSGYYDNTDLFGKLGQVMALQVPVTVAMQ